ncbi:chondroadherin-like [Drosophila albomicans]|uniref:Chondroadherin-like n=1 Tax=Drosophila albomicans TaxID=7291 RepID=A0A6P8X269_DROAB|nr:chondroadherin-like [Drosophila albomicans]
MSSLFNSTCLCLICCVVIAATQNCEIEGDWYSDLKCQEVSSLQEITRVKSLSSILQLNLVINNNHTELIIGAANFTLPTLMGIDLHVPHLELRNGAFANFPDLGWITMNDCGLEQLEKSYFSIHRRMLQIRVSHNKLKFISKGVFENLFQLVYVYLDHNDLTHLELPHMTYLRDLYLGHNKLDDFNCDCPHLLLLYLNDNQLTHVDSTSFQQLPELLELQLSGNLITDIGKNTFQSLTKLRTLNLSRNALTSLPADVFGSSIEQQFTLQQLDLSHNNINVLFENQFELLGGLQLLDLSGNKIAVLKSAHFAGLISLRHLYLGSNDNMELRGHTFETLKQLETLDLSHIGLDILGPHLFGYKQEETESIYYYLRMAHMRKLNLNGNKLQHLHLRTFAKLSSLKELYLSNNALRFLSASVLDPIQNLRKLDVSYNQLAEISSEVLNRLNNITDLHIDNNQLTFLPNLNGTLPHLQSVAIKGNPWQCVCLMELKDWLTSRQVNYEDGSNVKCVETTFDYCVQNVKDDRRNDAENELEFWRTTG